MTTTTNQLAKLAQRAYRIRRYALRMGEVQGQGYIGQALGWADVLAVAYGHAMNFKPDDPQWEGLDRFLLSPFLAIAVAESAVVVPPCSTCFADHRSPFVSHSTAHAS